MRVFLSWSGTRSQMLAEALRDWLPGVLQVVRPWMSAVDMQVGSRWSADLARELEQAKVGILCVTPDNQTAPWMIFEAGALSKIIDASCVIPYLLGMRPGELQGPLVQFQAAVTDRHDTFRLVSTVNRSLGDRALTDDGLERSFAKWWPELEEKIAGISNIVEPHPPPRPEREILEELLNLARQNTREQIEKAAVAEQTALLRQQDMATLTHQIQAPLLSATNALAVAISQDTTAATQPLLEHARALVEDTLALGYGISTALMAEQGRSVAFRPVATNILEYAREVATRLQRTHARDDLTFRFIQPPEFPRLLVDVESFTSVLYGLISNALKYADRNSEVTLEVGFEGTFAGPSSRPMPVLKLKTIGAPIYPEEKERIFEKFARGRNAERGRLHMGVGLGLWVARQLMRDVGGDVSLNLAASNPRSSVFIVHFGVGLDEQTRPVDR